MNFSLIFGAVSKVKFACIILQVTTVLAGSWKPTHCDFHFPGNKVQGHSRSP